MPSYGVGPVGAVHTADETVARRGKRGGKRKENTPAVVRAVSEPHHERGGVRTVPAQLSCQCLHVHPRARLRGFRLPIIIIQQHHVRHRRLQNPQVHV